MNIEDHLEEQRKIIRELIVKEEIRINSFNQLFASFASAVNYGAYDWNEFIRYCNSPCYLYKEK